jgi:hypothetical protein
MNNPVPFIVIMDDLSVENPDQMSKVIAARLQGDARLVLVSPILRTEEVPAGAVTAMFNG